MDGREHPHQSSGRGRSVTWRGLRRRWRAGLLSLLATVLVTALISGLGAWTPGLAMTTRPSGAATDTIPLSRQPFYGELLQTAERWNDAPLGQVVGESPRQTLLNFYVVMARVNHEIEAVTRAPQRDAGWFWSRAARQRIRQAEELFQLAVQALDSSAIPESIRDDMAEEAAIQLKQVLDYVFSHSSVPISIPDSADLKSLNSQRNKSRDSWTLPDTAITLSSELADRPGNIDYLFSATTVGEIGRMYAQISPVAKTAESGPVARVPEPLATPHF